MGQYNAALLSIVSTPIGNLGDITFRAHETLQKCHGIICEDTRVTGKLLSLLRLPKKELVSFHSYSDPAKAKWIVDRLKSGAHFCLVCDAGTPCISDPGYLIVALAKQAGSKMEVLPGPSAFLAALSASGLPMNQFVYLGFLPIKKGRQTLLKSFREEERTIVFYESPHRILKSLHELKELLAAQTNRRIVICRELTKLHEDVTRTTLGELQPNAVKAKGEFVIVLEGR